MPNSEKPLAQIHQYVVLEDDEEIFASLVSRVLEANGGYRAWHILNIGDGDDDDSSYLGSDHY